MLVLFFMSSWTVRLSYRKSLCLCRARRGKERRREARRRGGEERKEERRGELTDVWTRSILLHQQTREPGFWLDSFHCFSPVSARARAHAHARAHARARGLLASNVKPESASCHVNTALFSDAHCKDAGVCWEAFRKKRRVLMSVR